MVYIDITSTDPVAYIPVHGWDYTATDLELTVKNTTDGGEMVLPILSSSLAGFLVQLPLQLPEGFYLGEWQYQLAGGDDRISTGLLMAYDGGHQGEVQYNAENITIQYGG